MEKKKKKNWFLVILGMFFIAYISLYILNLSGYYDGNIRRKVEFTNKQIAKFEEDVKNGENIDINKYLEYQNKDYTNNVSKLGYSLSTSVNNLFNKGIKTVLGVLSKILS